jgi:DNA-directed RNA polymerase specialized sigma24 family protein
MTPTADRSQELLSLEPRLLDLAAALTRDTNEARILVHDTLKIARDPAYGLTEQVPVQIWIFRLMRQRFYSLDRDRDFRRSRTNFATEHAYARKRAELAKIVAEEKAAATA